MLVSRVVPARAVTNILLLLAWLSIASLAVADTARRVVLADPDPELRRAVESSLRPWRIEVIVDPGAPSDVAAAQRRADDRGARFVVWREGGELVVFDRETSQAERREARAGSLNPLGAEAAALSIKTMMRLPPPPEPGEPGEPAIAATTPSTGGIELRVEAGAGSRYERGLDSNVALRFSAGAMIRPWRGRGWRFGVTGDLGAGATVDQAGFKGTWSNWSALGYASWTVASGPWELEPWIAGGVERSSLEGTEMSSARSEHATLPAFRGGIAGRRRFGMWLVGLVVAVETVADVPTYTKLDTPADVFEVPPFSVVGGIVIAADLVP